MHTTKLCVQISYTILKNEGNEGRVHVEKQANMMVVRNMKMISSVTFCTPVKQ